MLQAPGPMIYDSLHDAGHGNHGAMTALLGSRGWKDACVRRIDGSGGMACHEVERIPDKVRQVRRYLEQSPWRTRRKGHVS